MDGAGAGAGPHDHPAVQVPGDGGGRLHFTVCGPPSLCRPPGVPRGGGGGVCRRRAGERAGGGSVTRGGSRRRRACRRPRRLLQPHARHHGARRAAAPARLAEPGGGGGRRGRRVCVPCAHRTGVRQRAGQRAGGRRPPRPHARRLLPHPGGRVLHHHVVRHRHLAGRAPVQAEPFRTAGRRGGALHHHRRCRLLLQLASRWRAGQDGVGPVCRPLAGHPAGRRVSHLHAPPRRAGGVAGGHWGGRQRTR